MGVSRRNFLHWGGFLAMGATVSAFGQRGIHSDHSGEGSPGNTVHAVPPIGTHHGGHPDLRQMTKDTFAPYVGSGFKVTQGTPQPVWIRLISAEQFPANPTHQHEINASSGKKTITYMLRFLGSSEKALPQGTYTLEHDKLGTIKLLLVPSNDGQQLYAAIVTHLQ